MEAAVDKIRLCTSLGFVLVLAIWCPLHAQTPEPAQGKAMTKATMMEHCRGMKAHKQKLAEDIEAQDAQLTQRLAEMNRAPDDRKTGLMASIITQMAEQRMALDARKAKMEDEMMRHMMEHMQMGKESMAECPVMKGKSGMGSANTEQKQPTINPR